MKIKFKSNTEKKVMKITGKTISNIKLYKDGDLIADFTQSKDIEKGLHYVKAKFEYTDGTSDVLENQVFSSNKDIHELPVNFKSAGVIFKVLGGQPLFWLSIVLSFTGIPFVLFFLPMTEKGEKFYKKNGANAIMKIGPRE